MIRLLREKKNQLILVVILLVTFSWVPTLDNYSDDYTDASILQAGAAYATARGINALISTLQTSTIQVGLGVEGSIPSLFQYENTAMTTGVRKTMKIGLNC